MWRLSKSMTGVAMLVVLAGGCGSTGGAGGDDALVLQFVQWDNTNITQADAVSESSADVDVVQDLCTGATSTPEPFTQTVINAVFHNNEGSDIRLEGYTTEIGDKRLTQSNIVNGTVSATLTGGRCSNQAQKRCVVDNDCALGAGTCDHSDTRVVGIVLFDFLGKDLIRTVALQHPEVIGQATPLKVTFFGSDPNRTFQTFANYTVTFGNFDNCKTSGGP